MDESAAWKHDVYEALKSENAVSLKKVESFIAEGEKLPFQYPVVSSNLSYLFLFE